MNPVKTCVYAISLNEIKHVDNFMKHCAGADLVLVCDTGSTDGTVERLRKLGAVVHSIRQRPWRFDVPRNTALNLIPADIDICLSIDLDEYLQPGWAEALDQAWQQHQGEIDRVSYDYIWNWNLDGTPDVRFFAEKIHHRHGFRWKHPCHETLYFQGERERRVTVPALILEHHADMTKSRGQYLPLLKMAVEEDPQNDRMSHYYGRELMFQGQWQQSITEFERHLALPTAWWQEERASSLRYIARCYSKLGRNDDAVQWAIKATQEWAFSREPWIELARCANASRDWATGYWAITKALAITERGKSYMSEGASWGYEPYDLGALCAYYSGLYAQAIELGKIACSMAPNDPRLKTNLDFYLAHSQ